MSEERKVGENFDAGEADSIFDKLRNVEGKIKPKRDGKFDASGDPGSGKRIEAIKLYNEVIFTLPDSSKAYEALMDIYQKQGDVEAEKDLLKKAISNCKKNEEFKKRLNQIK